MATTEISVAAADNEVYVIAIPADGYASSELLHVTSGFGDPVSASVRPQAVLASGDYTLVMVGINWGGPQNFKVVLTTDGQPVTYAASPLPNVPGANWTQAVQITV